MRKSHTRRYSGPPRGEERLRSDTEIRELLASARRFEAGGLRIALRPNGTATSRTAVVVGRGAGSAVSRNREKRITREAWRSLRDGVTEGHDIVFVVHRFGANFADRVALMQRLLDRAGIRDCADR